MQCDKQLASPMKKKTRQHLAGCSTVEAADRGTSPLSNLIRIANFRRLQMDGTQCILCGDVELGCGDIRVGELETHDLGRERKMEALRVGKLDV